MESVESPVATPAEQVSLIDGTVKGEILCREQSDALFFFFSNVIACVLSNDFLSKVWALYFLVLGIWCNVTPHASASAYGLVGFEGETFNFYLLLAMGYMITCTGVTAFIVSMANSGPQDMTGGCSTGGLCAIGGGLLVRVLFYSYHLLTGTFSEVGLEVGFTAGTTVATFVFAVGILSGKVCPQALGKIISLANLCLAVNLYFNTVGAAKMQFGVDVGDEEMNQTRAFLQDLAMEDFLGDLLMATLSFGVPPVRAMGVCSLVYPLYIMDIVFNSGTWTLMGFTASPLSLCLHSA